jgi:hypothetical protein
MAVTAIADQYAMPDFFGASFIFPILPRREDGGKAILPDTAQ